MFTSGPVIPALTFPLAPYYPLSNVRVSWPSVQGPTAGTALPFKPNLTPAVTKTHYSLSYNIPGFLTSGPLLTF